MNLSMLPLINRLDSSVATSSPVDLLMDNPETSPPNFSTIAPFLLHSLVPTFRLRRTSRVPDVVIKEIGFELIPLNKIGLNLVHTSDLGALSV